MAQPSNREHVKVFFSRMIYWRTRTTGLAEGEVEYETWAARITSHLRSLAQHCWMAGEDPNHHHPTTGRCADSGLFMCYAGTQIPEQVPDVSPLERVGNCGLRAPRDQQPRGRHDDLRFYAGQLSIPTDDLHLVTCDEK